MLRRISLAKLGLIVGGIMTIIGFIAYFADYPTLNLAGFFYGIPILLGGLALKASELKPVAITQPTTEAVVQLREQQATETQNQVRLDVTRYRYGESAHLIEAIERLGLGAIDEDHPTLIGLQETVIDGAYALVLEFDSPFISLEEWKEKQEKIARFFGPNIRTTVHQADEETVNLALIAEHQAVET
ncbi:MAG: DUF2854 domain-containing protein [Microcoleaceae cyanobacterium]